jgi:hypothetical protein
LSIMTSLNLRVYYYDFIHLIQHELEQNLRKFNADLDISVIDEYKTKLLLLSQQEFVRTVNILSVGKNKTNFFVKNTNIFEYQLSLLFNQGSVMFMFIKNLLAGHFIFYCLLTVKNYNVIFLNINNPLLFSQLWENVINFDMNLTRSSKNLQIQQQYNLTIQLRTLVSTSLFLTVFGRYFEIPNLYIMKLIVN